MSPGPRRSGRSRRRAERPATRAWRLPPGRRTRRRRAGGGRAPRDRASTRVRSGSGLHGGPGPQVLYAPLTEETMGRRIVVVMPAYNAEATLERTWRDLPRDSVDEVILVDDANQDRTVEIARRLNLTVVEHERDPGYGGDQKTCSPQGRHHRRANVSRHHPDSPS